jgi:uncharacterized membrane protein
MLYKLGRFLQLLGLLITPIGIAGNLAREEEVPLKTTLTIAAVGIGIFYLGWLIQTRFPPGS